MSSGLVNPTTYPADAASYIQELGDLLISVVTGIVPGDGFVYRGHKVQGSW